MRPVYKDEWISPWTYPTRHVTDPASATSDGIAYRVCDFGPGGDCDANSIGVMEETEPNVAFVGDLVFNIVHSYLADGAVLAWLGLSIWSGRAPCFKRCQPRLAGRQVEKLAEGIAVVRRKRTLRRNQPRRHKMYWRA